MQDAAAQLALFADNDKPDAHPSGFSVRVSGRAKRLSIKVYPRGRVEVVAPRRTSARAVQAFVSEHTQWIQDTRAAFAAEVPPEAFQLPRRLQLPAIGVDIAVEYRSDSSLPSVRVKASAGKLVLKGPVDDESQCLAALKRWLKSVAKREFEPRLQELSRLTGNPYQRMQVRGQKTCWGSHSSSGTISINYSLLFLAPELLRYLMIHELCHARHMNHSARFWRLVGRFEPDYKRLDKALADSWRDIPVWLGIH